MKDTFGEEEPEKKVFFHYLFVLQQLDRNFLREEEWLLPERETLSCSCCSLKTAEFMALSPLATRSKTCQWLKYLSPSWLILIWYFDLVVIICLFSPICTYSEFDSLVWICWNVLFGALYNNMAQQLIKSDIVQIRIIE